MHWLLRIVMALILAVLQTLLLGVLCYEALCALRLRYSGKGWVDQDLLSIIMLCAVAPTLFIVFYRIAPRLFGYQTFDGETRCRKCGYILRGITEPRCPECGERI